MTIKQKLSNLVLNHLHKIEKNAHKIAKSYKKKALPLLTIEELLQRAKLNPIHAEGTPDEEAIINFFNKWNITVDAMIEASKEKAFGRQLRMSDFDAIIKTVRVNYLVGLNKKEEVSDEN